MFTRKFFIVSSISLNSLLMMMLTLLLSLLSCLTFLFLFLLFEDVSRKKKRRKRKKRKKNGDIKDQLDTDAFFSPYHYSSFHLLIAFFFSYHKIIISSFFTEKCNFFFDFGIIPGMTN